MFLPFLQIYILFNVYIGLATAIPNANPSVSKFPPTTSSEVSAPDQPNEQRIPWIKDYLAYKSLPVAKYQNSDNDNLSRTIVVSCDDCQAYESELCLWSPCTQTDGDHNSQERAETNVFEIDVESFIAYLVEHKNFTPEELGFLRSQNLDYGYDEIESELSKIRRNWKDPQKITIGGEGRMRIQNITMAGNKSSNSHDFQTTTTSAVVVMPLAL